jgi:hypothetical protein
MNTFGLLYLVGIALLITLFFSFILRIRGPWGSFWTFFVITLLGVAAAGMWIQPVGPVYWETYWLPPLAVGLLIALILAATTPSPRTRSELAQERNKIAKEHADSVAVGIFFWFLLIIMLVIVVLGYIDALKTTSGKWEPAEVEGVDVSSLMVVPVTFDFRKHPFIPVLL